jgi:hypothetical protein
MKARDMKKLIAFSVVVLAMAVVADPLTLTWNGGSNGNLSEEAW